MLKLSWLLRPSKVAEVAGMVAPDGISVWTARSPVNPVSRATRPRSGLISWSAVAERCSGSVRARSRSEGETSKAVALMKVGLAT